MICIIYIHLTVMSFKIYNQHDFMYFNTYICVNVTNKIKFISILFYFSIEIILFGYMNIIYRNKTVAYFSIQYIDTCL